MGFEFLQKLDASFISTAILTTLAVVGALSVAVYLTSRTIRSHFSASTGREKRRTNRMACNYIMDMWSQRTQAPLAQARVLDLSGTGARIACMAILNPGDSIIGKLHQTEHGDIRVTGRVMWKRMSTTSPLYGIRFDPAGRA